MKLTLWEMGTIVFFAGILWGELRAIKSAIVRLEQKQEKYNNLQERMSKAESSCSAAHKRISELHFGHREE